MKLATCALVALLAVPTAARAESYDAAAEPPSAAGYVSVGALGSLDNNVRAGAALEAGVRLGDTPLFARGLASAGAGLFSTYSLARLGVEARRCVGRTDSGACAFAGVDVGVAWDRDDDASTIDEMATTTTSYHLVPRVGAELGGALRLRVAVERPYSSEGEAGWGLIVGGAYVF